MRKIRKTMLAISMATLGIALASCDKQAPAETFIKIDAIIYEDNSDKIDEKSYYFEAQLDSQNNKINKLFYQFDENNNKNLSCSQDVYYKIENNKLVEAHTVGDKGEQMMAELSFNDKGSCTKYNVFPQTFTEWSVYGAFPSKKIAEYDSNNNLTSLKIYEADRDYVLSLAKEITYEYENNLLTNQTIHFRDQTYSEYIYEYNASGYETYSVNYEGDSEGKEKEYEYYITYDNKNNILSKTTTYGDGTYDDEAYEYDEKGNYIKCSFKQYKSSEKNEILDQFEITYEYDENNNVILCEKNGKKPYKYVYRYDSHNHMTYFGEYDTTGAEVKKTEYTYTYDDKDNLTTVKSSTGIELSYSYDDNKNLIGIVCDDNSISYIPTQTKLNFNSDGKITYYYKSIKIYESGKLKSNHTFEFNLDNIITNSLKEIPDNFDYPYLITRDAFTKLMEADDFTVINNIMILALDTVEEIVEIIMP